MNLPLILNPEAEADLADAIAWYDSRRTELGNRLLEWVEKAFDELRRMPHLYGKVFQDLRLTKVGKFPYVVVYRIDDDQITVVAVYHARRDPRGWQSRAWKEDLHEDSCLGLTAAGTDRLSGCHWSGTQ